jgi:trehalose-phosphatase
VQRKLLRPDPKPSALPANLLPELARRRRLLLCLDYDGTISEITREPRLARPINGMVEVLRVLAAHRARVAIAVISGRSVSDLRSMLQLPDGIAMAGVHGLQVLDATGKMEVARELNGCQEDLARVRLWLEHNLPVNSGFIVEDKSIALALHYRQTAPPTALYVRESFEQFIAEHTSSLRARHGKMVIEAVPKDATKASALRTLWNLAGSELEPVYFGDDLTDEDAFLELSAHGISILVGEQRPSAAHYRVDAPADVLRTLKAVAAVLES